MRGGHGGETVLSCMRARRRYAAVKAGKTTYFLRFGALSVSRMVAGRVTLKGRK